MDVLQNLFILFAFLTKNELLSLYKLQIGKSVCVQCSVIENSLNLYEISLLL